MSTPSPATLYYWPSGARPGGKGVGHVALKLADGTYVSHVPERVPDAGHLESWTRTDVPTMPGQKLKIVRWASIRDRTLEADLQMFGQTPQTLALPATFIQLYMAAWARGRMLATPPGGEPLHGPLPYYQLADSVKGAGDRSQCATTVAKMLSAGLPLTHQEVGAEILSKFDPDSLWDTMMAVVRKLA